MSRSWARRLTASLFGLAAVLLGTAPGWAVTEFVSFSFDVGGGLAASSDFSGERVRVFGTRRSAGAYGTGPVNYISGATAKDLLGSSGMLDVDFIATGPGWTYGSGTGYKFFVQFYNVDDPRNFIAIGLINDPGACPLCRAGDVTLMVEGNSTLVSPGPIGGYWSNVALSGNGHHYRIIWSPNSMTIILDNPANSPNPQPLVFPIVMTKPSISFIGAARLPGDTITTEFQNIVFTGATPASPTGVSVPSGNPYVRFSSPIKVSGAGTGYNGYIHISDVSTSTTQASGNAMSVGIQADTADPNSRGRPFFMIQRVINGVFDFRPVAQADTNPHLIELAWWQKDASGAVVNTAVFSVDGAPIASFPMPLTPRLIFALQGSARLNGDNVVTEFTSAGGQTGANVVFFPPQCTPGGNCDLNGSWNLSVPTDPRCLVLPFCGLTSSNLNGVAQEGATFRMQGTVTGIPAACPDGRIPGDWDCYFPVATALIAQQWFGE